MPISFFASKGKGSYNYRNRDTHGHVGRTKKKGLESNKTFILPFFGIVVGIGGSSFVLWATKFSK